MRMNSIAFDTFLASRSPSGNDFACNTCLYVVCLFVRIRVPNFYIFLPYPHQRGVMRRKTSSRRPPPFPLPLHLLKTSPPPDLFPLLNISSQLTFAIVWESLIMEGRREGSLGICFYFDDVKGQTGEYIPSYGILVTSFQI